MFRRKPDLTIGPRDNPYMLRWELMKFFGQQICLHKICRSDDERALHDHRANNFSLVLWGEYNEIREHGDRGQVYGPLSTIYRKAEQLHRLVLNPGEHVWTLWWRGRARKEWGFNIQGRGWIHWRAYIDEFGEDAT